MSNGNSHLSGSYDCVVIGAGNGGLGTAAQLAAKGAKVLAQVVDKDPQELGYSFTIWTVDRLRHRIEKEPTDAESQNCDSYR